MECCSRHDDGHTTLHPLQYSAEQWTMLLYSRRYRTDRFEYWISQGQYRHEVLPKSWHNGQNTVGNQQFLDQITITIDSYMLAGHVANNRVVRTCGHMTSFQRSTRSTPHTTRSIWKAWTDHCWSMNTHWYQAQDQSRCSLVWSTERSTPRPRLPGKLYLNFDFVFSTPPRRSQSRYSCVDLTCRRLGRLFIFSHWVRLISDSWWRVWKSKVCVDPRPTGRENVQATTTLGTMVLWLEYYWVQSIDIGRRVVWQDHIKRYPWISFSILSTLDVYCITRYFSFQDFLRISLL